MALCLPSHRVAEHTDGQPHQQVNGLNGGEGPARMGQQRNHRVTVLHYAAREQNAERNARLRVKNNEDQVRTRFGQNAHQAGQQENG